jgi:hypothetical protein
MKKRHDAIQIVVIPGRIPPDQRLFDLLFGKFHLPLISLVAR